MLMCTRECVYAYATFLQGISNEPRSNTLSNETRPCFEITMHAIMILFGRTRYQWGPYANAWAGHPVE